MFVKNPKTMLLLVLSLSDIFLYNVVIYCSFYVIQGAKAWYIPSSMCGILGIFVSSLIVMLPETKRNSITRYSRRYENY